MNEPLRISVGPISIAQTKILKEALIELVQEIFIQKMKIVSIILHKNSDHVFNSIWILNEVVGQVLYSNTSN